MREGGKEKKMEDFRTSAHEGGKKMTKAELRIYIRKAMMEAIDDHFILCELYAKALGEKICRIEGATGRWGSIGNENIRKLSESFRPNAAAIEKWKKAAVDCIYHDVRREGITDIPGYIEDCIEGIAEVATFSRKWNRYFWDARFLMPEKARRDEEYDNTSFSWKEFVMSE